MNTIDRIVHIIKHIIGEETLTIAQRTCEARNHICPYTACRVSDLTYCKYLQGRIADNILEKLIERLTENE